MNTENASIFRRFIMEYGTIIGLLWSAIFFLYVIGLRSNHPFLLTIAMCMLLILPFVEFFYALRLKIRAHQLSQSMNFLQSLFFLFNMLMYSTLICAAIEFGYFEFFDKGTLIYTIQQTLDNKEALDVYTQMGMNDTYSQLIGIIKEYAELSSFEKTLLLFNQNFIISAISSFIFALLLLISAVNRRPHSA